MAQYGDAFKHFVQALRLDPGFAEAHYGIGYAYLNLDNFKDALPYLRQAVRLRPDYAEARLALGKTHLGLRDVRAAEAELKALAGLNAEAARALEKEVRAAGGVAAANPQARLVDTLVYANKPQPSREEAATPKVAGGTTEEVRPVQTAAQPPAAKPTSAARRKGAAAGNASLLAVELSFWESIKESGDAEEFAAYLRKYPEGQFAELARIRTRSLEGRKGEASNAGSVSKQEPAGGAVRPDAAETSPPDAAAAAPAQPATPPSQRPAPDAAAQVSTAPPPEERTAVAVPQPSATSERPTEEKPSPDGATEAAAPATIEAALGRLRTLLASKFSYKVTTAGGESGGAAPSTSEVNVSYEPLKFEGCTVEWRDQNDALWVTLSDLDPDAVRVAPRTRPGQTFSTEVWDVSISALGGRGAFSEAKGDGSGTVNRYNGLDLQYDAREKAERLAAVLRQTIRLCAASP
jgi:hypothetical protein